MREHAQILFPMWQVAAWAGRRCGSSSPKWRRVFAEGIPAKIEVFGEDGDVLVRSYGVAAHGARPSPGVNALSYLCGLFECVAAFRRSSGGICICPGKVPGNGI